MPELTITVDEPPPGHIDRTTVPQRDIFVRGSVHPSQNVTLTVDGIATPLDAAGGYRTSVPDQTELKQEIRVEATMADDVPRTVRARRMVLHAPVAATPDGFSEGDGATGLLHFTTAGLDKLKPMFEQRLLVSDFDSRFAQCYYDQNGAGIWYRIIGTQARIGDIHVQDLAPVQAPGSRPTMLFGFQLDRVRVEVSAETFTCGGLTCNEPGLRIGGCAGFFEIPGLRISAMFEQVPTAEPGKLEIRQIGLSSVTIVGEIAMDLQRTDGGAACVVILEDPSNGLRRKLPEEIPTRVQGSLDANHPRTELAVNIEQALNDLRIAAPIGDAVGMRIETKFARIEPKSLQSLAYHVFTRMDSRCPEPCSTQFDDSWGVVGTVPDLDNTTPNGESYDVALAVSPSSINPILTGFAEQGKLTSRIELSAREAGLCDEQSSCPNYRVVLHVRPSVPPFVNGVPGPGGTMTELHIVNLLIDIDVKLNPNAPDLLAVARVAVDAVVGLDFVTRKLGSEIALRIPRPDRRDIDIHVLDIASFVSETQITNGLADAVACRLPGLADTVGGFELPPFEGFELRAVELQGPRGANPWFIAYMSFHELEMVGAMFDVPAGVFTDTGIRLPPDTRLAVNATGNWSFNNGVSVTSARGVGFVDATSCMPCCENATGKPDGLIAPNLRLGALVGFFSVFGDRFEIGERFGGTAPSYASTGPLYLAMNDVDGTYSDNTGVLRATVKFAPPHAIRTVAANVEWVDTGLDVTADAPLRVIAEGEWSYVGSAAIGPDGTGATHAGALLPSAGLGILIGRVGDVVFPIGGDFGGNAPASGRLYLSINDVPGTFNDNQGAIDADVGSPGLTEMARPAAPLTPCVASVTCAGDCSGNGVVTVDELVRGVSIALGRSALASCRAFDLNEDGRVSIDELVRAANAALGDCS